MGPVHVWVCHLVPRTAHKEVILPKLGEKTESWIRREINGESSNSPAAGTTSPTQFGLFRQLLKLNESPQRVVHLEFGDGVEEDL